uniref:Uncharacterized protein n=1 Tax=Daphnia galeata TaxID=27404 RepID=A0A8J2WP27_9CRUS|nr:unnamed protein product [Daphnia galeata]
MNSSSIGTESSSKAKKIAEQTGFKYFTASADVPRMALAATSRKSFVCIVTTETSSDCRIFVPTLTGTSKFPTSPLGTSKTSTLLPRCALSLPYLTEKSMDGQGTIKHGWFNGFFSVLCEFTDIKVQVQCFFPSNTTSIYQPVRPGNNCCDQDALYKTHGQTPGGKCFDELQVEAKKLPNGKQRDSKLRTSCSCVLGRNKFTKNPVGMNCQLRLYLPAGDDQDVSRFWTPCRVDRKFSQANRQIQSEAIGEITGQFARLAVGSGSRSLNFSGLSVITNAETKTKDQQETACANGLISKTIQRSSRGGAT